MQNYLYLQSQILHRSLKEIGLPPFLVYITAPFLFYFLANELFVKTHYAVYIFSFFGISFVIKFSEKKKNDFLKFTFKHSEFLKIRLLENSLVIIPFTLFLLFKKEYTFAVIILIIALFMSLISFKNHFKMVLKTPFFKYPFEFCIGFRKTFWIFIFAYFLTIMAVKESNYNLGVFSLLLMQFIVLQFYIKPENVFYVWIHSMNPKEFIRYKFKIIVLYSTFLCVPIILSLCIYFPDEMLFTFGILGLSYFFIFTGMLAKYTAFPDEISIKEIVILLFLVWFPPILILIIPYFYSQSIKKLNNIL